MATVNVIDRQGAHHSVAWEPGLKLMEALRDRDMVRGECGGLRICATCHVYIAPDWLGRTGAAPEEEVELIDPTLTFDPGRSRLACQIPFDPALDGLQLTLAPAL